MSTYCVLLLYVLLMGTSDIATSSLNYGNIYEVRDAVGDTGYRPSKFNFTDITHRSPHTILNNVYNRKEATARRILNATIDRSTSCSCIEISEEVDTGNIDVNGLLASFPIHIYDTLQNGVKLTTQSCAADISQTWKHYKNHSMYAMKLITAGFETADPSNSRWFYLGDYEMCTSVQSVVNNGTRMPFSGRYFSASFRYQYTPISSQSEQPLTFGFCLPDSCGETDFGELLDAESKNSNISVFRINTEIQNGLTGENIVGLSIISVLVILGVIGSIYDFAARKRRERHDEDLIEDKTKSNSLHNILKCFSFMYNSEKLLSMSIDDSPFPCLNALRVLSIFWIIQWNTYTLIKNHVDNATGAYQNIAKRFLFQPIVNGSFPVDTFFFLSGLFIAYLTIKQIRSMGTVNWFYFFIFRYGRVTPIYSFALMLFITLFSLSISGPYAMLSHPIYKNQYYRFIASCRSYWWTNLLYFNNIHPNYGKFFDGCMGWSWYLATDMQMHVLFGPLLVLLLHKKPKIGFAVGGILVCISIAVTAFLTQFYGLKDVVVDTPTRNGDPWNNAGALYTRVYVRCPVYIIGMLTGYLLLSIKEGYKPNLNRFGLYLIWTATICTGLAIIYGPYYFKAHPEESMSDVAAVFYIPLSRSLWAMCTSVIALMCSCGYGGPINYILSWPIWVPLSRMTLSVYLMHPMVIFWYTNNLTKPIHFSPETYVVLVPSIMVLAHCVALVVILLVESPMLHLLELFMHAKTDQKRLYRQSVNACKNQDMKGAPDQNEQIRDECILT